MQAIKLELNKSLNGTVCDIDVNVKFSFRPFIDYVTRKAEVEKTAKVVFYQYILNKFKVHPELWQALDTEDLKNYLPIFELIYSTLSPLLSNENQQLWAVGKPLSPCFYSGTNAFYKLLLDHQSHCLKSQLKLPTADHMKKSMLTSFYNLVLERFYNFNYAIENMIVRSILDEETKLLKYYRLNFDTRFLNVKFNGELPDLKLQHIKDKVWNEENSLKILQSLLPLEKFTVEGMSIVNMVDVTAEHALDTIKNVIIKHHHCQKGAHKNTIELALKTLVACVDVEFGVLPYIMLNEKVLINNQTGFEGIVAKLAGRDEKLKDLYAASLAAYVKDPRRYLFPEITKTQQENFPLLKLLVQEGITSYGVFPLYYNGSLVGALEVYTRDPELFKNYTLVKLESAFPLLSQLLHNMAIEFNHEINDVITDQFTALQPAVQWRFHEAAHHYIASGAKKKKQPIEKIVFSNVHPLYGAIDIKDSSIKRNQAMRADLFEHSKLLQVLLLKIRKALSKEMEEDILDHTQNWSKTDLQLLSDRKIILMEDYLLRQLPSALLKVAQLHPELSEPIQAYIAATQNRDELYVNSLRYEESLQQLNQVITLRLENFNAIVQAIFPSYFERFRTDGVEYDLYVGQSIAPDQQWPENLISILRFKQLEVMVEIARATISMMPELAVPLQTTQLIFIYEKLIDISFRIDEQRFDVEGAYNIRYQMVKKRIDKAHVKNTLERITQPGKITLIYFNNWEATEYMGYIKQLQAQNLLLDDVEFLEIEELQGVDELKALRVSVAAN